MGKPFYLEKIITATWDGQSNESEIYRFVNPGQPMPPII